MTTIFFNGFSTESSSLRFSEEAAPLNSVERRQSNGRAAVPSSATSIRPHWTKEERKNDISEGGNRHSLAWGQDGGVLCLYAALVCHPSMAQLTFLSTISPDWRCESVGMRLLFHVLSLNCQADMSAHQHEFVVFMLRLVHEQTHGCHVACCDSPDGTAKRQSVTTVFRSNLMIATCSMCPILLLLSSKFYLKPSPTNKGRIEGIRAFDVVILKRQARISLKLPSQRFVLSLVARLHDFLNESAV
ncbi:unnamed protein product [Protopolystoma xenopodis]|uniref:Uncharacterized protein n=1 Tax=Protopolystoma xenopodis TaxID=117903 RepID=A0A448XF65_9PLAT|nr:unnamed protein product [Protopolystoma xenopodis]